MSIVEALAEIGTAAVAAVGITPMPSFGRLQWTDKRWVYKANQGPIIVHMHPAGKGKPRKAIGVPSHRLVPIDRSKYPGDALRAIRRSAKNFNGEARR
jgi:hypothetical protein